METRYFNGKRFTRFGNYFRGSRDFLHREIWKHHFGEIPEGFHVHHKDGNRDNNDISNLECVPGNEHISEHHKGHGRYPSAAIEAAKEWSKTPEAKAILSERGKKNIAYTAVKRQFKCQQCGHDYVGMDRGVNRFCSNACKSAYRRATGADSENRNCAHCGVEFSTNKFGGARFCSKSCGRKHWFLTKREEEIGSSTDHEERPRNPRGLRQRREVPA